MPRSLSNSEARPCVTPSGQPANVHTIDELNEALAVRVHVFVDEQDVPIEEEVDRYDVDPATHAPAVYVLGRRDGKCIATGPVAAGR